MAEAATSAGRPVWRPRGRVLPAAEAARWQTGQDWLQAAEQRAQAIVAAAEEARAAARREGYAAGHAAGAAEAARLLAETAARAAQQQAAAEPALIDLALAVVERLLGACDEPQLVAALARQALAERQSERALTLKVAPGLAEAVRAQLADCLAGGPGQPVVAVEPDPGLQGGACVLASELGFVELGLDAQLQALRTGLARATSGAS